MSSNYKVNGINDLSTIFLPRITPKPNDVGYSVNGSDISNIYEKSYNTLDRINYDTGFKANNGADLRNIFRSRNNNFVLRTKIVTHGEGYVRYANRASSGVIQFYVDLSKLITDSNNKYNFRIENFGNSNPFRGPLTSSLSIDINNSNTVDFEGYTLIGQLGGQIRTHVEAWQGDHNGYQQGNYSVKITNNDLNLSTQLTVYVATSGDIYGGRENQLINTYYNTTSYAI